MPSNHVTWKATAPYCFKPLRPCSLLCVTLQFLHKKRHFFSWAHHVWESFKKCRHYAYSAINTRRNPSPKMARFPMTKIPGTLDSAKKRWAPGFPGTYFQMIRKYLKLAEVANFKIKKQLQKPKPPRVYNAGRSKV